MNVFKRLINRIKEQLGFASWCVICKEEMKPQGFNGFLRCLNGCAYKRFVQSKYYQSMMKGGEI